MNTGPYCQTGVAHLASQHPVTIPLRHAPEPGGLAWGAAHLCPAVVQEAHRVHSIADGATEDRDIVKHEGRFGRIPRSDLQPNCTRSVIVRAAMEGARERSYELPSDVQDDGDE